MSDLYICKEYNTLYEEGYSVVRTVEEHNKIIYNRAIDEIIKKLAENDDTMLTDKQYYTLMELKKGNEE